jgi:hypothetical protein
MLNREPVREVVRLHPGLSRLAQNFFSGVTCHP